MSNQHFNTNSSYSFSGRNPIQSLSQDRKYVSSSSLTSLNDTEDIQRAQIDHIDTLIDSQKSYVNTLKTKYEELEHRHKHILNELINFKNGKYSHLSNDNVLLKQNLLEEKKMRICAEVQLDILSHLLEYEMNEIHRCKALTSTMTEDRIKLKEELRNAQLREDSLNNEISRLRERAGRLVAETKLSITKNIQIQNNLQKIPVYLIWCRERGKKIYLGDLEIISKYLQKLDLDAQIWTFCIDKLASLNPRLQKPKFMKDSYEDYMENQDIFAKKSSDFRVYSQNLSLFEVGEDSWNPGKVPFDIEPIYMRSKKTNQIKIYLKDKITYTMECMLPVDIMDTYANSLLKNKLTMFLFESLCENWIKTFIISLIQVTKEKLKKTKEDFYQLTNVIAITSEGLMEFLISEEILTTTKKTDWANDESRLILLINWSSRLDPDLSKSNVDLEELESVLNFLLFNGDFIEYKGIKYYFSCTQIHISVVVTNSCQSVFTSTSAFTMRNKFFSLVDCIRVEETDQIAYYTFPNFPMVYVSENFIHATLYKLVSWNQIKRTWRQMDSDLSETAICERLILSKILKLWEMIYEPLKKSTQTLTIIFDKTLPWFPEFIQESNQGVLIGKFIKWLANLWNELISKEIPKFHAYYSVNGHLGKGSHKNCERQVFNLLIEPILFDVEQRVNVDRSIFHVLQTDEDDNESVTSSGKYKLHKPRVKKVIDENSKPRFGSIPMLTMSKNAPIPSSCNYPVKKSSSTTSASTTESTMKTRPLSGQIMNKPRDSLSLSNRSSINRAYSLRHNANQRQTVSAKTSKPVLSSIVPRPTMSESQSPVFSCSLSKVNRK